MLKRYYGIAISALSVISFLVGFGGCTHTMKTESTPKAISKNNIPARFNVVGLTASGKPVLLEHEVGLQDERKYHASETEFRNAQGSNVLWSEDCRNNRKYSFYIDASNKEAVESVLTAALKDEAQSITIKILEDHPASKQQKVYIQYWNDEYNCCSVYAVDNQSIRPLQYGDLLKSDGLSAFSIGFFYMILFYTVGRIAFAVAIRRESRKDQQT